MTLIQPQCSLFCIAKLFNSGDFIYVSIMQNPVKKSLNQLMLTSGLAYNNTSSRQHSGEMQNFFQWLVNICFNWILCNRYTSNKASVVHLKWAKQKFFFLNCEWSFSICLYCRLTVRLNYPLWTTAQHWKCNTVNKMITATQSFLN